MRQPQAEVQFAITYADGRTHAYSMVVGARHRDLYWLTFTNQDCWASIALLLLYPDIVSQVPPGAEYGSNAQCQPASSAG